MIYFKMYKSAQKIGSAVSNSKMLKPLLVAFDFDHTIVDKNTDIVVKDLLPKGKIPDEVKKLYRSDGWTAYMQKIFELLHQNGITYEKINETVRSIPVTKELDEVLRALHRANCDIIIISDSNSVFIEEWLEANELRSLVHRVFTNPAHYDPEGLLNIQMYHFQDWCDLSTKNLCKGHILKTFIQDQVTNGVAYSRVAYVGDGKNDLCPSLKLSEIDLVFPRIGYTLSAILARKEYQLKARTFYWDNGADILKYVTKYISSEEEEG